jgi:hypothetical protein
MYSVLPWVVINRHQHRALPLPALLLNVQPFRSAVWIPDVSSGRSSLSTTSTPKSFPLNSFADPHPLNPVHSILYKNIGGQGASQLPRRFPLSSILRTLFQVPYPVSPLFATLTKTPGVWGYSSHFGTHSLRQPRHCRADGRPSIPKTLLGGTAFVRAPAFSESRLSPRWVPLSAGAW